MPEYVNYLAEAYNTIIEDRSVKRRHHSAINRNNAGGWQEVVDKVNGNPQEFDYKLVTRKIRVLRKVCSLNTEQIVWVLMHTYRVRDDGSLVDGAEDGLHLFLRKRVGRSRFPETVRTAGGLSLKQFGFTGERSKMDAVMKVVDAAQKIVPHSR